MEKNLKDRKDQSTDLKDQKTMGNNSPDRNTPHAKTGSEKESASQRKDLDQERGRENKSDNTRDKNTQGPNKRS